jgi:hypothetical protein
MSRRRLLGFAAAVALLVAWYLFRPERAIVDRHVNEAAPEAGATLLSGQFQPRAHEGKGTASVIALADGRRVLRLEDFATLNGPDLQVYLLGSAGAEGRADLARAGFLSLGALKGNVGPQNYEVPVGADLSRYEAVAVWCRRFGVNFTTARLAASTTAGS